MASVSYGRAVALAALQAVLSSTWIAARELSPARRRLARAGTVAAVTAVGWVLDPKDSGDDDADREVELVVGATPFAVADGAPPPPPFDKRKAALAAGAIGISVAAVVGRRHLERRWLARLTRNGHRHPTRALAARMAALEFAAQLALQLNDVRKERARQVSGSNPG
ncbi:hypothetical protein ACTI_84070 [Actinoplanes sp. OR16]|uniref:hypothetical protein n=1 Tax=Actinoplanes sp. OR16 TaxID=946334 RepID=UPI000F6E692B|nr:hypothetical protein [Actinoplanes sp. OR16]BBH71722.1 hypothetical protein ACTI_84070 [Actinoplanes sp. OR16]